MSIKNEVNKLSQVYKDLLIKENINEVNIGVPPTAPSIEDLNPPCACKAGENCEDNMMGVAHHHHDDEDNNRSMAKSETYKIYKSICSLQKALMASECNIEPWMLSKITKAADYVCSVSSALEYDEFEKMKHELEDEMSGVHNPGPVVVKVRDMLASEDIGVNEQVLKQVIFNIECLKEAKSTEKVKPCKFAKKGCKCNGCKQCKANKAKK